MRWDIEKHPERYLSEQEVMKFSEKDHGGTSNRGSRNTRRGNPRPEESRGQHQASKRKEKSVSVVCSKAKGKDRLTGRARRWDAKEQEEHLQVYPESSLQEFLEELDALCAPENVNPETESEADGKMKQNGCENPHPEPPCVKTTEKKVRFSEDHQKSDREEAPRVTNGTEQENRETLAQNDSECIQKEMKMEENCTEKHTALKTGERSAVLSEAELEENQTCLSRGNEELMCVRPEEGDSSRTQIQL